MLDRIRNRVLLVVGIAATLGLATSIYFFSRYQERTLIAQHESSMRKLSDAVSEGLHSVMLAGSADIAQAFSERLKRVPDITEFRIMRIDGTEAFLDNKTIANVNERRGEEMFSPRDTEARIQVMQSDDPELLRAIADQEPAASYHEDAFGNLQLDFLAPLKNAAKCYKCHGKSEGVRGVVRLSISLAAVERDIWKARQRSFVIFSTALIGIVLLIGYLMGRIVVRPIEKVTDAMSRVAGGDLDYRVGESSKDEIGRMGASFNKMTRELRATYRRLRAEEDKLTTVIEAATEGIVVTDATGRIVLVNPAVVTLLGKTAEKIVEDGFSGLFNDAGFVEKCLNLATVQNICFNNRDLQVVATVIHADQNRGMGQVALVRDVSEIKRLEDDLRKTSTTDALTELYNRRFLDATLGSEYTRAIRGELALSVVMMDIDHFKKFNDTHGHDQGDRVLQMVSRCLRETVRSFDFPCRYGGEEYVLILPGMRMADALQLAERLRIKVQNTTVDGLNVHISLGVSSIPELSLGSATAMIEAADSALYRAKENGRNRVEAATVVVL